MEFVEVLTIVLIVLKLLGVISWSWWLVLLPELLNIGPYALIVICEIVRVLKKDWERRKGK